MVTGIISRNNRRRLEIAGPDFRGQWNTKDDNDVGPLFLGLGRTYAKTEASFSPGKFGSCISEPKVIAKY